MNYKKAAYLPLLVRIAAFLVACIILTAVVGPKIISSGILYKDGFGIYGGLGKALLFGSIAFIIIARNKFKEITLNPWKARQLLWILLSIGAILSALYAIGMLASGQRGLQYIILTHALMLTSVLFAAGGTLGPRNLRLLVGHFRKEIAYSLLTAVGFYVLLLFVYSLWPYLSYVVLYCVYWLLHLAGLSADILPGYTLLLSKFGVTIEKYCSGIESIALFTGLYVVVALLDWNKLNKNRFFIVFPIALAVLFALNILRVFILIVAGYYINIQIAFTLFHTYAGMVFFILYAALFWGVMYKHLLKVRQMKLL